MSVKSIFLLLFLSVSSVVLNAQDLNCNIQINSDQIQGTNKSVFNTLQKSMMEFVNNRRWTEMSYTIDEKIECSMNIVKKVENNVFSTEIQVQSRRPVYNSSYNSTLFNYKDNEYVFEYKEFDQLEMIITINSNLTVVLAYYAYLIIGYDMDSYSRLGGTPFFQTTESIVNAAQAADLPGLNSVFASPRNRYALINNIRRSV